MVNSDPMLSSASESLEELEAAPRVFILLVCSFEQN